MEVEASCKSQGKAGHFDCPLDQGRGLQYSMQCVWGNNEGLGHISVYLLLQTASALQALVGKVRALPLTQTGAFVQCVKGETLTSGAPSCVCTVFRVSVLMDNNPFDVCY